MMTNKPTKHVAAGSLVNPRPINPESIVYPEVNSSCLVVETGAWAHRLTIRQFVTDDETRDHWRSKWEQDR